MQDKASTCFDITTAVIHVACTVFGIMKDFLDIGSYNENNGLCFKLENFISTIENFLIDLTFRTVYGNCFVPLHKNEECLTLSAM